MTSTPQSPLEASGQQTAHRLPLVELKAPVFQSAEIWQPARARTRDLPQQRQQPQQLAAVTPRCRRQQPQPHAQPQPHQQPQHHQLLHREASQITIATVAMERQRRSRRRRDCGSAASTVMELDGRHMSAVGQRRRQHKQQHQEELASPPPPTTVSAVTAAAGVPAATLTITTSSTSLPFVRRHLRRYGTLLELTSGQDRLVVDPFADSPSPGERLARRMRACGGDPTPGQARILAQQRQQQPVQQATQRHRLSRREKTAQTISSAILTYDRSL